MKNLLFIAFSFVFIYGCNSNAELKKEVSEYINGKYVDEHIINDSIWKCCYEYNKYLRDNAIKIIYGYETGWSEEQVSRHTEKMMQLGLFTMGINNEPQLKIPDGTDICANASLEVANSELEQYTLTIKRTPLDEVVVEEFMADNYGKNCLKSKQDSVFVWVLADKAIAMGKNEKYIQITYSPYNKYLMDEISTYGDGLIRPREWKMKNWEEFVKIGRFTNKLNTLIMTGK